MEDPQDQLEHLPHPDLEYRRLRLFSIDMDSVRHGVRLLLRYRRDDVRFALLRDVVVTYSRPFVATQSPRGGKFTLGLRFVPREHRTLHHELIRVRNALFAHSDLQTHQPQLLRSLPAPRRVLGMSFANADYRGLLRQVARISALAGGVDAALITELVRLEQLLR